MNILIYLFNRPKYLLENYNKEDLTFKCVSALIEEDLIEVYSKSKNKKLYSYICSAGFSAPINSSLGELHRLYLKEIAGEILRIKNVIINERGNA